MWPADIQTGGQVLNRRRRSETPSVRRSKALPPRLTWPYLAASLTTVTSVDRAIH